MRSIRSWSKAPLKRVAGDPFPPSVNQSTYIPIGETHRLKNPGPVELEIIEIQSVIYLGEDDIVRLLGAYERAVQ